MTRARSWIHLVVLAGLLAACADDGGERIDSGVAPTAEPTAQPERVELVTSDACGEVYFWAATASGDLAVTVSADLRPSAAGPTTLSFSAPDDGATVEILRGTNMPRNFCTDVIDLESEPTSREPAAAGSGTITIDALEPGDGCGTINGSMEIEGLVAADGTTFAPVEATADSIGCYAG